LALLAILLMALLLRLGFNFRAPPFVTNDSLSYLLPGFDLLNSGTFAPILKRPPFYSLFISGVFALFGEDLRLLMLVQHLLGVGTVALAYGIGRLLFGTVPGLLAALLTALSGPIIVTEHYLMSEALFTFLLAAGLFAYFGGIRARSVGLLMLAGALLGVAALTRPIAQLVLVLLLVGLPFLLPRWRPAIAGVVTMLALFAVVVLPWMARNAAVQGTFAIAGGTGEGLAVRTIRYEQRFDFREPPGGDADRQLARARRIYRDEAEEGSAFELARRLRDELNVSEIEAERLMRTISLQAIMRQPVYYLTGTAGMLVQTFAGRTVRLRQDWLPWRNIAWDERVQHLLPVESAVEQRGFAAAERLATLYDPARYAWLLAVFGIVGILAGMSRGRRPILILGGLVVTLLVAGAALIGIEWRYRFPLDPLINVLAAGGLVTSVRLALGRWRRIRAGTSRAPGAISAPARTTG
jgi:4-amino-4-deoxy-L-arabinose transferase-like glycosyltransferase